MENKEETEKACLVTDSAYTLALHSGSSNILLSSVVQIRNNMEFTRKTWKTSEASHTFRCTNNNQLRKSYCSTSMLSESNSSGSSGYVGQQSTFGDSRSSNSAQSESNSSGSSGYAGGTQVPACHRYPAPAPVEAKSEESPVSNVTNKQDEFQWPFEVKLKRKIRSPGKPPPEPPKEEKASDVVETLPCPAPVETIEPKDEIESESMEIQHTYMSENEGGFTCVISMHDGVVMYSMLSVSSALYFPRDMWVGRPFIDFVHPRDRSTFAAQISSGLAPDSKNATLWKNRVSTLVCRIRRYKYLTAGYEIKYRAASYLPFALKIFFRNVNKMTDQVICLVIQATPLLSAYKTPNEKVANPIPFTIRHSANGKLEYVDPEIVTYLGYMPQDVLDTDMLQLYHPSDLVYLLEVYKTIVKEGGLSRSKPYRLQTQNGDYVKCETKWCAFINLWSRKLEFVVGKSYILEGPENPDVFEACYFDKPLKVNSDLDKNDCDFQTIRESIRSTMNDLLTKPAVIAKQEMIKRCQDIATFTKSLAEASGITKEDPPFHIVANQGCNDNDFMVLGGSLPYQTANEQLSQSSSTETTISYHQINYNETLRRYFISNEPYIIKKYGVEKNPVYGNISPTHNSAQGHLKMLLPNPCNSGPTIAHSIRLCREDCKPVRLTASALNKHNAEMEKELVQLRRKVKYNKNELKYKYNSRPRHKKMEHNKTNFERLVEPSTSKVASHGVKRSMPAEDFRSYKHRRSSLRRKTENLKGDLGASTSVSKPELPSPHTIEANPAKTVQSMNVLRLPSSNFETSTGSGIRWCGKSGSGMYSTYLRSGNNYSGKASTSSGDRWYDKGGSTFYSSCLRSSHNFIGKGSTGFSNRRFGKGGSAMYSTCLRSGNKYNDKLTQSMETTAQKKVMSTFKNEDAAYKTDEAFSYSSFYSSVLKTESGSSEENEKKASTGFGNRRTGKGGPAMFSCLRSGNNYSGKNTEAVAGPRKDKTTFNSDEMAYKTDEDSSYSSFHSFFKTDSGSSEENDKKSKKVSGQNKANSTFKSDGAAYKTDEDFSYSSYYSSLFKHDSGSSEENDKKGTETETDQKEEKSAFTSDGTAYKTDEDSSYSSFYTTFFKTDSGSSEENDKKPWPSKNNHLADGTESGQVKIGIKKKIPPWMEQVSLTPELIYKYQVAPKTLEEVLLSDKLKLQALKQPNLVNDQLSQLYLELQLEGAAARLTLDEGITSTSSSDEETVGISHKKTRSKEDYSKLIMMYEENAPLPPAEEVSVSAS